MCQNITDTTANSVENNRMAPSVWSGTTLFGQTCLLKNHHCGILLKNQMHSSAKNDYFQTLA